MTEAAPWRDPNFVDPTPDGNDGWPNPPRRVSDGPSPDMANLDEAFPPGKTKKQPPAARKLFPGATTPKMPARAPSVDSVAAGATSVAVACILWAFLSPEYHQLPIWLTAITGGALSWWVWSTAGRSRGLMAAASFIVVAGGFALAPVISVLVAIVAIAFIAANSE